MAEVLDILLIVLVLVSITVLIYILRTVINFNKFTENMEQDLSEIKEKALPVLDNLNEALENINAVSSRIEKITSEIDDEIGNIKNKVVDFREKMSSPSNFNPLTDFIKRFSSIQKGFSAFWSTLRNR